LLDDLGIDAVDEASRDVGGDFVSNMCDKHGDRNASDGIAPPRAERDADESGESPADEMASSQEWRASATSVAYWICVPTRSL